MIDYVQMCRWQQNLGICMEVLKCTSYIKALLLPAHVKSARIHYEALRWDFGPLDGHVSTHLLHHLDETPLCVLVFLWLLKQSDPHGVASATEIYSHSSGAESRKTEVSAGSCSLKALGNNPSLPPPASDGPILGSLARGSIPPILAHIFTWPSSLCVSLSPLFFW